ncbi:FtsX-like permease family protein [Streptosporangium sp. NPDC001681]|uniref:FtsX-like permease family protein n=1 Tax=Streptosporangium sp. NPDC001681 TaxID=3154395 RepID=UPI0033258EBF
MTRLVWAQLRHRLVRALVLLLGIVVAATGFTVLTGTAETQRLEIIGTVGENFRAQYDILVRPENSATAIERSQGLVRANYLSGIFGGITFDQYERIKRVNGVEVAAPIGMIGHVVHTAGVRVDVTDLLHEGDRTMLRVERTRVTDRGLTRIPFLQPQYEYVTRRPVTLDFTEVADGGEFVEAAEEELPGGRRVRLATSLGWSQDPARTSPFPSERMLPDRGYWSTRTGLGDGGGYFWNGLKPGQAGVPLYQEFPFVLAAVDPDAEARLAGLAGAMVEGRYLTAKAARDDPNEIPLIAASVPYADQRDEVVIRRLPAEAAEKVTEGVPAKRLLPYLAANRGEEVRRLTLDAGQVYESMLDRWSDLSDGHYVPLTRYWASGPVEYRQRGARELAALPVRNGSGVWKDPWFSGVAGVAKDFPGATVGASDTQFRTLNRRAISRRYTGDLKSRVVGRFDPARLPGFSELTRLPMETYNPPVATPGDGRTAALLGGRALLPNDNVAGYLQTPPLLLTSLQWLEEIAERTEGRPAARAPLSVIRVRVDGVTGPDPVSRERISQVARDIVAATGLKVDITVGSSPSPMTVDLPAGSFGRPALTLREDWVNKNVAYRILNAADRKSLVLFVLVLAVCGLFVLNGAAAIVRARRSELGVLACLGWSRPKLFGTVLCEVGAIGLLAGLLSVALAWPVALWSGGAPPGQRAWLAVPAAVMLALSAGLLPAWQASRVPPAEAVRPAVRLPRRARSPRGVAGLAVSGLTRSPGRTLLGAATLAAAVFGLTVLLGVTYGFRGRVVGSLLGDAIVVQARPADYAAVAVMFGLAVLAVADVLYLGVRERDTELAALRASGWSGGSLARLIVLEGAGIGLLGALAGVLGGVTAAFALAGDLPSAVVVGAAVAAVVAVTFAALASAVPALLVQRLPLALILTRE